MTYGTYGRDTLIDPAPGGLGTYVFEVGHSEEEDFGNERNFTVTHNTADGIAVIQQGDSAVPQLTLRGTILTRHQHETLAAFTKKSGRLDPANTLIYRDFYGEEYEVLIDSYKVRREGVLRNRRDPGMNLHIIKYTLIFTVIDVRAGAFV